MVARLAVSMLDCLFLLTSGIAANIDVPLACATCSEEINGSGRHHSRRGLLDGDDTWVHGVAGRRLLQRYIGTLASCMKLNLGSYLVAFCIKFIFNSSTQFRLDATW